MQPRQFVGQLSRRLVTQAAIVALTIVVAAPAFAGVEKNPNAIPFGPAVCDDGREIVLSYTPTDPSPVGFDMATGNVGVSKSLALIVPTGADPLGDHLVVEVLYDRPGKGLDRNLVRCVFPYQDTGLWVAVDVKFND